jgi:hypothetical protein
MSITLNGTTGITTPALDSSGPLTSLGIDDNATSTAITIDASNNVGIGTSSPSGYDSRANNLVVGDAGDAGITIFSGATSNARLQFAPSGSTGLDNGLIGYDNSNDLMVFATGGSDRMRIDSTGAVTMPYQPAFLVRPASTQSNLPLNGSTTIIMGAEIFDQNSDFSSNTFTAPVAGRYQFAVQISIENLDTATAYYQSDIITSNRNYQYIYDPTHHNADVTYATFCISALADMDAGDTAYVRIYIPNSGAAQANVGASTSFSGYLAC